MNTHTLHLSPLRCLGCALLTSFIWVAPMSAQAQNAAPTAVTPSAASAPLARPSAADVERLLAVNGAQAALQNAVAGIEAQVRQQVVTNLLAQNGGKGLTPQQQTAVDKAIPGIGTVLRQEMGWARLKGPYVQLYQNQLSAAEVQRLTQLYQDPGYVTLMQKMGTINQQSAQLITQRLPTIMQRIQPVLEDALKGALDAK